MRERDNQPEADAAPMDSHSRRAGRAVVLIPTYDEADNVERVLAEVLRTVPADVLVIDDNSPDGTGLLAQRIANRTERVFVMHRPSKEGLGRAYLAGIRWALKRGYDFIVQMDCDASHEPAAAADLIQELSTAHIVVGSRYVPGGATIGWPRSRRILSRLGSWYSRVVLGLPQRDATSGFKAWRSDVLRRIDLEAVRSAGYSFQIEMAYRAKLAGAIVREIPIIFPDRGEGRSKLTAGIITEALRLVIELRIRSIRTSVEVSRSAAELAPPQSGLKPASSVPHNDTLDRRSSRSA